jgi:hypothetical protein
MAERTTEQMGLAQATEILKYHYLPGVDDAFNNETVLLKRFKRRKATVMGDRYIFSLHKTRNWATAPRAETGVATGIGSAVDYLPPPGVQVYDQAELQRTHYYGRFKVTGASLSAAKGEGAMIDLLGREMTGIKDDVVKTINRALCGENRGALALVTGADTGTYDIPVNTTARLEVGMPITLADMTGGACANGTPSQVIVSIDEAGKTFNVAADPGDVGSSDAVFLDGEHGSTFASSYYGMPGLEHIVNSTTGLYANINRSSTTPANTWWDAERVDGSGGLSIDLMLDTQQRMRKNANGKLSLILTGAKQWRAYGNLIDPSRRWAGTIKKLDGAFDSLDFNGVPIVWDPDIDDGQMYFLDESTWTILEEEPLGFMDRDGSVLTRVGSGATAEDAYEATLVWRGNLRCGNPHRNAVIYDLPE